MWLITLARAVGVSEFALQLWKCAITHILFNCEIHLHTQLWLQLFHVIVYCALPVICCEVYLKKFAYIVLILSSSLLWCSLWSVGLTDGTLELFASFVHECVNLRLDFSSMLLWLCNKYAGCISDDVMFVVFLNIVVALCHVLLTLPRNWWLFQIHVKMLVILH